MSKPLSIFKEVVLLELRVQRRNPVWMLSLGAAGILGFAEAFSLGVHEWPTLNQAFRAYHLACVMVFGVMTFIMTAGSFSRDLSGSQRDLLLSRPIGAWVYVSGKYVGNVLLALAVSVLFMGAFVILPLLYGQSSTYRVGPFALLMVIAIGPTILYSGALASLLMCASRRVIIALPTFLVYFLSVSLFRIPQSLRGGPVNVDLWDFSMRLYPHMVAAEVGRSRLGDESFSHLLQPVVPELYVRAALYAGLSIAGVVASVVLLKRMRNN